ncbi:MAG: hypothetical protein QW707_06515 [Candidatus Bathyarchaeia archaeon]
MGAYICTISERDWNVAREQGVYGNRFEKREDGKELNDSQKLSVIRDLISIKEGDLIFFHIRGRMTLHGVYRARSCAIWDNNVIWEDPYEVFPCRFLFEPHPDYEKLCLYDAHINVSSLYELIDQGKIRSLVTLEFEQNIEARAVKRIFVDDAKKIIRLLYRDFKKEKKVNFNPYMPSKSVPLKDKIFRVGGLENAIKAVISWKLAYNDQEVKLLGLKGQYDFVNEFFVAPTTRKNIDFLCESLRAYIILEIKKDECDERTLKQSLYYADLLGQRPWINKNYKKIVVLIGKSFNDKVKENAGLINKINSSTEVKLIKYKPTNNGKWAKLMEEKNYYDHKTLF